MFIGCTRPGLPMGASVLAAAQFTIDPAASASRVDATTAYDGAAGATGLQPDADGDATALSIALKKHVPGNACALQHSEAYMRPHTYPVKTSARPLYLDS